jgi:hypothetical protein
VHATGKNDIVKVVEENRPGCQVIRETDSVNQKRGLERDCAARKGAVSMNDAGSSKNKERNQRHTGSVKFWTNVHCRLPSFICIHTGW